MRGSVDRLADTGANTGRRSSDGSRHCAQDKPASVSRTGAHTSEYSPSGNNPSASGRRADLEQCIQQRSTSQSALERVLALPAQEPTLQRKTLKPTVQCSSSEYTAGSVRKAPAADTAEMAGCSVHADQV